MVKTTTKEGKPLTIMSNGFLPSNRINYYSTEMQRPIETASTASIRFYPTCKQEFGHHVSWF